MPPADNLLITRIRNSDKKQHSLTSPDGREKQPHFSCGFLEGEQDRK